MDLRCRGWPQTSIGPANLFRYRSAGIRGAGASPARTPALKPDSAAAKCISCVTARSFKPSPESDVTEAAVSREVVEGEAETPPQTSKSRPVAKSKPTRTPLYEFGDTLPPRTRSRRRSRPFGDRDRGHRSPLEPTPSTLRACNRSPPEKGEFPPAEDECVLARKHGGRAAAIFRESQPKGEQI